MKGKTFFHFQTWRVKMCISGSRKGRDGECQVGQWQLWLLQVATSTLTFTTLSLSLPLHFPLQVLNLKGWELGTSMSWGQRYLQHLQLLLRSPPPSPSTSPSTKQRKRRRRRVLILLLQLAPPPLHLRNVRGVGSHWRKTVSGRSESSTNRILDSLSNLQLLCVRGVHKQAVERRDPSTKACHPLPFPPGGVTSHIQVQKKTTWQQARNPQSYTSSKLRSADPIRGVEL